MKSRSMSAPRELLPSASEYTVPASSRFNLLPQHMFNGHKSEYRALLPHRKPTIRLRAPHPPKWHFHIERGYEDLYDPSPTRKKAKLRAARLSQGLHKPSHCDSSREMLFPTETDAGRFTSRPTTSMSHPTHRRSDSGRIFVSSRCGEVISRAESLLVVEKENTSKLLNGYKRESIRLAGNADLMHIFSDLNRSRGQRSGYGRNTSRSMKRKVML